jgi:hypothetical protein
LTQSARLQISSIASDQHSSRPNRIAEPRLDANRRIALSVRARRLR